MKTIRWQLLCMSRMLLGVVTVGTSGAPKCTTITKTHTKRILPFCEVKNSSPYDSDTVSGQALTSRRIPDQ
jgi:hypothetical protein